MHDCGAPPCKPHACARRLPEANERRPIYHGRHAGVYSNVVPWCNRMMETAFRMFLFLFVFDLGDFFSCEAKLTQLGCKPLLFGIAK